MLIPIPKSCKDYTQFVIFDKMYRIIDKKYDSYYCVIKNEWRA